MVVQVEHKLEVALAARGKDRIVALAEHGFLDGGHVDGNRAEHAHALDIAHIARHETELAARGFIETQTEAVDAEAREELA